jgi:hypothetical protein
LEHIFGGDGLVKRTEAEIGTVGGNGDVIASDGDVHRCTWLRSEVDVDCLGVGHDGSSFFWLFRRNLGA